MKKKTILWILLIILAILILLTAVNWRTAVLTWYNLTVPQVRLPEADEWSGGQTYLAIPYAGASESEVLDLYVPDAGEEKPELLVIIHGGGFIAGDSQTKQAKLMYRYFRDHGYACATVNYRLAQEAAFPAAVQDCKAAIRFLRANAERYGYDAGRIVAFGESAGGYLASMCAFTTDDEFNDLPFIGQTGENNPSAMVDALLDYYPYVNWYGTEDDYRAIGYSRIFADLANSWMKGNTGEFSDPGSYWLRREVSELSASELEEIDPFRYLEKNAGELSRLSVYLVHGDADITVPIPSSERLAEACRQALEGRIVYRVVPHMGHASDLLYDDAVLEDIAAWLEG